MKLNLRDPLYVSIILAICFFWWGSCEKSKRQNLEREQGEILHREQVQRLEVLAKTAGARADSLQSSFVRRRAVDSVALSGLKMRNKGMSENVHILREPVQPLIDSIQALARFVRAYDSLLVGKDQEIRELELRHEAQIIDLTGALKERGDEAVKEREISESWRLAAVESEKDVKKERRKKAFWRTTASILAGGVIFLTLQK